MRLRTPRTFPFCARGEPRAHFPNPRRTVSRDLGQGDKGRGAAGGRRRRTYRTRRPLGRGPRGVVTTQRSASGGAATTRRLGGRGDGVGDRCETLEEERRGRFRLKSEKAPETRQREAQTPGAQEGSDLEHTNKTTTATVRCPRPGERRGGQGGGAPEAAGGCPGCGAIRAALRDPAQGPATAPPPPRGRHKTRCDHSAPRGTGPKQHGSGPRGFPIATPVCLKAFFTGNALSGVVRRDYAK